MVTTAKPRFGAFNQGDVPSIACFNKAATPLGVDFDALIAAMQASPHRDINIEPRGVRMPVRDVAL